MNLTTQVIKLLPPEREGVCQFAGEFVVTRAAFDRFGPLAVLQALMVVRKAVVAQGGLDYLQVLEIDGERLWIIDDGEVVTALLPSDY